MKAPAMTTTTTQEAPAAAPETGLQTQNPFTVVSMTDTTAMGALHEVANVMARGVATVPRHLQGNVGDCMAVVLQAQRWGMNPYAVAQKTFLINGTLGYESQLVGAVINTSTVLAGRLRFEWFGAWEKIVGKFTQRESKTKKDDNGHPKTYMVPAWNKADEQGLGIHVTGWIKGEAEPRVLTLLMSQALTRNSTLWTEDPKQQLAYLAQKRWARLHMPEVLLGVYTPDELAQATYMGKVEDVSAPTMPEGLLEAAQAAAGAGRKAFRDYWKGLKLFEREALRGELQTLETTAQRFDDAQVTDAPVKAPSARKQAPAPDAPAITADAILARMQAAKTEDDLNAAIAPYTALSPDLRVELETAYDGLMATLREAS
jgi:hypothetical protein